jgi:hypothetical protein
MGSRNQAFSVVPVPASARRGAVGMTFFRLSTLGLALVVVTTSLGGPLLDITGLLSGFTD